VLSAIRAPVLNLWGAKDRLLPATSAEDFRKHIPGAQVELIPNCGHIPQLERPAYTRRRIREFVEKLQG
jgi:pimeloyl-ACP methyl ester carboxylesterase